MVFEWNCEWLHLPQSAVFNALVNLASPEGMPNLGRGCLNYGDAKITVTGAVSDVEETHHVTLRAHKFIQDGGRCTRSVCLGRRFRGNFGHFGRRWSIREAFSVAVSNVSTTGCNFES